MKVKILAAFLGVVVLAHTPSGAVGTSLRSSPLTSEDETPETMDYNVPCCNPVGASGHFEYKTPEFKQVDGKTRVTCYNCHIQASWYKRPGHYTTYYYGWHVDDWKVGGKIYPGTPTSTHNVQALLNTFSSASEGAITFATNNNKYSLSSDPQDTHSGRETLVNMVRDKNTWPQQVLFTTEHFKQPMACGEDDSEKMLWQYIVTVTLSAPNLNLKDSVAKYYSLVTRCTAKDYTQAPNCPAGRFPMGNGQTWDSACSQDAGINNCECCYKGNQLQRYMKDGHVQVGPLLECQ